MSSGDDTSLGVSGTFRLHLQAGDVVPGGPVPLILGGELDRVEADRLLAAITVLVREHPGRPIALDAGRLMFLDSGGVRALLGCQQFAEAAGSRLSIVAAGPIVHQVLEITGLLEIFGSPVEVLPER
ncbi:anti-anti-sigma factor [Actinoplanes octamycinicus]|uniref:Anti-anti-sigma factor n=1 Tax=Actinoplanes octamycinicus TaxID=135948 RepID=A0A7W7H2D9_9ACTN|nr:STAS domain-containing protein [Actinoplanes octamycinicus]MBB4742417.1 anti-anti-sigma factor [Actinoplanes octamycinicus]GIE62334.1 hypothetical protein Aoc01nite_77360 [Actinoplanes octamycinicus]